MLALSVCQLTFSQWIQEGGDIDGEAAGDYSGGSVSISADGTIVAIGATDNDGNGNNSGHTRVYQFDGVSWVQLGQDIDGEAASDFSGRSVSISADGTIVAIGAAGNDGNGATSGHTRVYQFDGVNWVQLGQDIDGEAAEDQSGRMISLNDGGNVVAIGAPYNDGNGNNSGHVRVYQFDGVGWSQLGQDIDGEAAEDYSGPVNINADGSIVAIGASVNDGNGNNSGHARVYQFDGVSWNQLGQDIDGEAAEDFSGGDLNTVSLSADGTILAVGARGNDGNGVDAGHVRVYQFDGVSWNQLGQDIDGEAPNDRSGETISLSDDGTIVAIGARYNSGNGINNGHVRVYQFDGVSWNQLGQDIDGENGFSGRSVSISADGNIVAIGAALNDGNGPASGHVRIYHYQEITFIPDPNFEQALIDQGLDSEGVLNGYLFTSDISTLTSLTISGLNIENLAGIEDFIALQTLICNDNSITQANFGNNRALTTLNISNNDLTYLNVPHTNLRELHCNGNFLSALDITELGRLETLYCQDNQLTALEVVDLSDLQIFHCYNNQLTGSLDLSNMSGLLDFNATNNPDLACIRVQNPEEAEHQENIYANWFKDPATVYSDDCGNGMMAKNMKGSSVKDGKTAAFEKATELTTSAVLLYPNPADEVLYITVADEKQVVETVLYTWQGEEVLRTNSGNISTANLPAGLYMAEIKTSDHKKTVKKVIISRD